VTVPSLALVAANSIRLPQGGLLQLVSSDRSDDVTLVDRVIARDESALESIYQQYGGAVHFVARKVLRDETLAEDVVQEVFVTFWNSPGSFDPDRGSLRTYLVTIAHRRAIDMVRSEAARTRREVASPVEDRVADIDDEVWARRQSEIVRDAVAQLGEDERDAISLAYFKGLTYVEVAKALAQPEGTVKSRIRSGMRKLSSALAEVAP
jgi:RNA polymerase sigma-70 factor, ECF subfamily